jgi:hypothetical protein
MFEQSRILNKTDNTVFYGEIDPALKDQDWYNFIEIPDDENTYIWDAENKSYKTFIDLSALAKQKTQDDISNRDSRLQAGVLADGVLYDMNTEAKTNIMVIISQISDTESVSYIDYNFNTVSLTKNQLSNILKAIINTTAAIYSKNATNQKALADTEITQDEINAVNIDYTGL